MQESRALSCPYEKCGKTIETPLVVTDMSKTPRETYYACPYCLSKVEIVVKGEKGLDSVTFETSDNPKEISSLKCPHHFGHLRDLPGGASIPEECLTCTQLIRCSTKK